jgi:hypothetical protein
MVALGQFRDARIRQQLAHAFDVEIEFEGQWNACGEAVPNRITHGQIDARIQVVNAVLQLEVGRPDLEPTLQAVGVGGKRAQDPRQRRDR